MWYIIYAAEAKKQSGFGNLISDTQDSLVIQIRDYMISFWKRDENRIFINGVLPNTTFLEVTCKTVEDFIKLLEQLYIIRNVKR